MSRLRYPLPPSFEITAPQVYAQRRQWLGMLAATPLVFAGDWLGRCVLPLPPHKEDGQ